MGSQFYFFTDPTCLKPQLPEKAFGAVSTAGGSDIFRVTSVHELLSSAPAVAICDGVLCAQEDGPGTLTLILKPSQSAPFDAPTVSYFIYKGVARSSLLNATGDQVLDDQDANANDLTKTVAVEWKTLNQGSLAGSRAGLGLDRDANFPPDDGSNPPKIFTGTDPVERLFAYPHKSYQLPVVKAGDVLGTFEGVCGFEIVLLRLGYKPELSWTRRADNSVSVVTIGSDNGGTPWQAEDHAFFSHWHDKEQVLTFLDPAAYFGAFVQSKLYKKSGGVASKVVNIYQDVLASFANRNAAWLDIRGNASYSYNLFGLYADTIRFVSYSDASQTSDKDFRAGGWPLLKLEIGDVPGSKKAGLHRTKLSLPVGSSMAPAVLVSKGFVSGLGPEPPKYKTPAIAPAAPGDTLYAPFRLAFPVVSANSQDVFVCSYTRVNLYEKQHPDPQPAAPLNIVARHYMEGVFRPRDLRLDQDFASSDLRFDIYPEEVLVDLGGRSGPAYSACVGVAEDAEYIALFAYPHDYLAAENPGARRRPLPSWAATAVAGENDFLTKLAKTFQFQAPAKLTIQPDDASQNFDALFVQSAPSLEFNPMADRSGIEDFCIVVFAKADHQSLLDAIAADAAPEVGLPAFLTIASSAVGTDTAQNLSFEKHALQSVGFAAAGGKATVHATPLSRTLGESLQSFLSALIFGSPYANFRNVALATTLTGGAVPDYGLFFRPDDKPKKFMHDLYGFDPCADFEDFDAQRLDLNILISRYERLFRFRNYRLNRYYLVPWVSIPGTKAGNIFTPAVTSIRLRVSRHWVYADTPVPISANIVRTLRLQPSANITAAWEGAPNPLIFQAANVNGLDLAVIVNFAAGQYPETGGSIEVWDQDDGRHVGSIRFLFLEKIKQKVLVVEVTTEKTNPSLAEDDAFCFSLANFNDPIHQSLESDGLIAGFVHNRLFDDANTYGFFKIGVELEIVNSTVDLVLGDSTVFSSLAIPPDAEGLKKNSKVVRVKDIDDPDTYARVFVNSIARARLKANSNVTFDKYSIIYVFVTRFLVRDLLGTTQINLTPNNALTFDQKAITQNQRASFQVGHAYPVSLSLIAAQRENQTVSNWPEFKGRDHQYSTLVHELLHGLSITHIWDEGVYEPERYFSLYLRNQYPLAPAELRVEDFQIGGNVANTLFDGIIANGMDTQLKTFLDTVFPPNQSTATSTWPTGWNPPYTPASIGDELIWRSLNSTVAFRKYETENAMDYVSKYHNKTWSKPLLKLREDLTTGYYFDRQPLPLSRFQWETARKAIRYFANLTPP
jgi:hypothetical protein